LASFTPSSSGTGTSCICMRWRVRVAGVAQAQQSRPARDRAHLRSCGRILQGRSPGAGWAPLTSAGRPRCW
jgi:hypothetical protein